jgi:hypothetical protein
LVGHVRQSFLLTPLQVRHEWWHGEQAWVPSSKNPDLQSHLYKDPAGIAFLFGGQVSHAKLK